MGQVNISVEMMVEKGIKNGKNLKEILEKKKICDRCCTSIYLIGKVNEVTKEIKGSEIEDDGDIKLWGPKKLSEILDYVDIKTMTTSWPPKRESYFSKNPNCSVDIGS